MSDGWERGEFCSTLIFDLARLDLALLERAGWSKGPWVPGSTDDGDQPSRFSLPERSKFLLNGAPFERLLEPDNRMHRSYSNMTSRALQVEAAEMIVAGDGGDGRSYLIVHLSSRADRAAQESIGQLAEMARPGRKMSRELLDVILPKTVSARPEGARAASVSLSVDPGEASGGLTQWEGSSGVERRLADLMTLAADTRVVDRPFLPARVVTPTVDLAVSSTSVAAVRRKVTESGVLTDEHARELQTFWTDALLVELEQHDAAIVWSERVRGYVAGGRLRYWAHFARRYRKWRTISSWEAMVDHPVEAAIADGVRAELRTDRLLSRIEAEIEDHATASSTRATWVLAVAVAALGLFPAIDSIKHILS
jgi:hypothetical protein